VGAARLGDAEGSGGVEVAEGNGVGVGELQAEIRNTATATGINRFISRRHLWIAGYIDYIANIALYAVPVATDEHGGHAEVRPREALVRAECGRSFRRSTTPRRDEIRADRRHVGVRGMA
jgi:hypothetical protein